MKYRVIRSETINTGIENLDQYGNIVLSRFYPKPGELFEGELQVDSNGNKSVCGNKNLMGINYPFCFSWANVQPVIAGIPINAVTLVIAGVLGLLLFKVISKK